MLTISSDLSILLVLTFSLIQFAETGNQGICKNKAADKHQILCIGKLRTRLILLSKLDGTDQYVYDLPLNSLNSSLDRLYLASSHASTLKDKWPALYSNPLYGNATYGDKVQWYNAFVALDAQSEYLLLTTRASSGYSGVVYDIDRSEAFGGIEYKGKDEQVLISSDELSHFYALHKDNDTNGLRMMRYRFVAPTVKESLNSSLMDAIIPDEQGQFYPLCKVGTDALMLQVSQAADNKSTCDPFAWPKSDLLKGFVTDEKFYLFGDDSIFVFARSLYDEPNKPVNFSSVPYADFLVCSGEAPADSAADTGKHVGIVIAIVLVLLIILLCCCLLCMREVSRRQKKRKKRSGSNEKGKKMAPGLSSVSQASVRSAQSNKQLKPPRGTPSAGDVASQALSNAPTARSDMSNQASSTVGNAVTTRSEMVSKAPANKATSSLHSSSANSAQASRI